MPRKKTDDVVTVLDYFETAPRRSQGGTGDGRRRRAETCRTGGAEGRQEKVDAQDGNGAGTISNGRRVIMRYTRKHHSFVEAIEWTGENLKDVQAFMFPASPLDHATNQLGINVYDPSQQYGAKTRLVFIGPGAFIVRETTGFSVFQAKEFLEQFESAAPEVHTNGTNGRHLSPEEEQIERDEIADGVIGG